MKRALLDTLDFYAEATPQIRLADSGNRARELLLVLNDDDDNEDSDAVSRLLARVNAVLDIVVADGEENQPAVDALAGLRSAAMEWQD